MRTAPILTGALLAFAISQAHGAEPITRETLFEVARPGIGQAVCTDSIFNLYGGTAEECQKQLPELVSACETKLAAEIPESFAAESANISKYGRAYVECVLLAYEELHRDSSQAKRTRERQESLEAWNARCRQDPAPITCRHMSERDRE